MAVNIGNVLTWVLTNRTKIGWAINFVGAGLLGIGKTHAGTVVTAIGSYVAGSGAHDSDSAKKEALGL